MIPAQEVALQPVSPDSAQAILRVYQGSPKHFRRIAMEMPTLEDVEREVESILADPNRRAYLIAGEGHPIGYLDYKLHYPERSDAIITLILIAEKYRGQGYGKRAVQDLEALLYHDVERLFAAVYGENPGAVSFWQNLGYRFLKEGSPSVSWFYKRLKRA